MSQKLYKVIKDNASCNGGRFNWSKYLPNGTTPGKWVPRVAVKLCTSGYHVTPYWNMWYKAGCTVYECEVPTEEIVANADDVGVVDKFAFTTIRLIKKVVISPDGSYNTGYRNTGNRNTGGRNTGNHNTGHRNTGARNTGNHNTGDGNTGDGNAGSFNTGYHNTGDANAGSFNTGNRNTGNGNAGSFNIGNHNTGNHNNGSFNTKNPDYYEMFNKPVKAEEYCAIDWPRWLFADDLTNSLAMTYTEDVRRTLLLPNWDFKIFEEITGISEQQLHDKINE